MFDSSLACFLLKACYNSSIDTSIKTKLKTGYCGKLSFKMICCKADSLHFFLSANLGPALCNSCVMLILSYLQAAPTCTLFCILCIQNAVITGFPNQPRTYFHAHILFHEWSAVAISIYIGCRQGDKAWWQSFSQLNIEGLN